MSIEQEIKWQEEDLADCYKELTKAHQAMMKKTDGEALSNMLETIDEIKERIAICKDQISHLKGLGQR